jgi:hypothetical protein
LSRATGLPRTAVRLPAYVQYSETRTDCNDGSSLFVTLIAVNQFKDPLIQIIPKGLDRIVLRVVFCICGDIVSKLDCSLLSHFWMPTPQIAEESVQHIGRRRHGDQRRLPRSFFLCVISPEARCCSDGHWHACHPDEIAEVAKLVCKCELSGANCWSC